MKGGKKKNREFITFILVFFPGLGQMSVIIDKSPDLFNRGNISLSCRVGFCSTNDLRSPHDMALADSLFTFWDRCSLSLQVNLPFKSEKFQYMKILLSTKMCNSIFSCLKFFKSIRSANSS